MPYRDDIIIISSKIACDAIAESLYIWRKKTFNQPPTDLIRDISFTVEFWICSDFVFQFINTYHSLLSICTIVLLIDKQNDNTFIGVDDVVRCHYCDGGLRNWESADDPWEEHSRWLPFCKYTIKMKGKEYIDSIRRKYEVWIDESHFIRPQNVCGRVILWVCRHRRLCRLRRYSNRLSVYIIVFMP
jgi:hypothetical protein